MSHPAPPPSGRRPPSPAPAMFPPPPPRSSPSVVARRRGKGLAAAVLTGSLLVGGAAGLGGAAAWSAFDDDTVTDADTGGGSSLTAADPPAAPAPAADGTVESVASKVLPSVVRLDVAGGDGAGSGSGVVLDEDGLILTNDHVVTLAGATDADQVEITASFDDGSKAEASVVGTDPLTDTALVRVDGVEDLTPVTLGSSDDLAVGQQVIAIGSPFGLDSTVTTGIVSALDRPVDVGQDAEGNTTAYPAIQTDAAINPGNSGGALVDMAGRLVGINASIRTAGAGSESGSIGLGFAIPIDEVQPIVEELAAGKPATHARLGIEVTDVATDPGAGAAVVDGAQVRRVSDGSAAGEAGLTDGDVITGIDDRPVSGADDLVATVRSYRPGDTVTVRYVRDGEEQSTDLELGSDAETSAG